MRLRYLILEGLGYGIFAIFLIWTLQHPLVIDSTARQAGVCVLAFTAFVLLKLLLRRLQGPDDEMDEILEEIRSHVADKKKPD